MEILLNKYSYLYHMESDIIKEALRAEKAMNQALKNVSTISHKKKPSKKVKVSVVAEKI